MASERDSGNVWLVYGARGWIGSQIVSLLQQSGDPVVGGEARADDYASVRREVLSVNPNRIICVIGRTSGPGFANIDYLEQPGKLPENLRDNLQAPVNLANIVAETGAHLTYVGTGCIYEFDETHVPPRGAHDEEARGFKEGDAPNWIGSQYSMVKSATDAILGTYPNVLNVRIRLPICGDENPRNLLTKLKRYDNVVCVPNSITVLPEMMPIMIDMARKRVHGTMNLTNPGAMTHGEILTLYKEIVDPTLQFDTMTLEESLRRGMSKRANNYLDTARLQSLYPRVLPIRDSIDTMFRRIQTTADNPSESSRL